MIFTLILLSSWIGLHYSSPIYIWVICAMLDLFVFLELLGDKK